MEKKGRYNMERLYTIAELAEYFSVTERTIHIWISEGKIKTVKVGRLIRIMESELKKFIEGGK